LIDTHEIARYKGGVLGEILSCVVALPEETYVKVTVIASLLLNYFTFSFVIACTFLASVFSLSTMIIPPWACQSASTLVYLDFQYLAHPLQH
jgi:hypothetical protein